MNGYLEEVSLLHDGGIKFGYVTTILDLAGFGVGTWG